MEMRYKLSMLDVKIDGPSILYGNNQKVMNISTSPSIIIKKNPNALSHHRNRRAIAAGIVNVKFMGSKLKWADILLKPLPPGMFHGLIH